MFFLRWSSFSLSSSWFPSSPPEDYAVVLDLDVLFWTVTDVVLWDGGVCDAFCWEVDLEFGAPTTCCTIMSITRLSSSKISSESFISTLLKAISRFDSIFVSMIELKFISSSDLVELLGPYLLRLELDDDVFGFGLRRMPLWFRPLGRSMFFCKCLSDWEINLTLLRSIIPFFGHMTVVWMFYPEMLLVAYSLFCPWARVTEGDITGMIYPWLGDIEICIGAFRLVTFLAFNLAASSVSSCLCSLLSSLCSSWICKTYWTFLYLSILLRDWWGYDELHVYLKKASITPSGSEWSATTSVGNS